MNYQGPGTRIQKTWRRWGVKLFCNRVAAGSIATLVVLFKFLVRATPALLFGTSLAYGEALKVSEAEIFHLESILKQHRMLDGADHIRELEKLFRSRSTAHRLRLSQIYLKVIQDPGFHEEFPEFVPLARDSRATVQALLVHDASKSSVETAKAIRVLALTQGINIRRPIRGFSANDQRFVIEIMKYAIDDLNTFDSLFMKKTFRKMASNTFWSNSHELLAETIDFYDTYKSRQSELAKDGVALLSPSQWIEKLERDGHYTANEMRENHLKKRLAEYLERVDPLMNFGHFAQAEDFSHLAGATDYEEALNKSFTSKSRDLITEAGYLYPVIVKTFRTRIGDKKGPGANVCRGLFLGPRRAY